MDRYRVSVLPDTGENVPTEYTVYAGSELDAQIMGFIMNCGLRPHARDITLGEVALAREYAKAEIIEHGVRFP